jgi:indolepyruvate ferredoxin oxidoreductase
MAYKDEYEVARLALLDESQRRYEAVGGPGTTVTYHLHPPALRSMGLDRKLRLGRSATPSFRSLRSMKRLRGTRLDPFGYAEVRRVERAMIPEYERAVDALVAALTADRVDEAITIAELPDQVRGYEHLKLERASTYRRELEQHLARWGRTEAG